MADDTITRGGIGVLGSPFYICGSNSGSKGAQQKMVTPPKRSYSHLKQHISTSSWKMFVQTILLFVSAN